MRRVQSRSWSRLTASLAALLPALLSAQGVGGVVREPAGGPPIAGVRVSLVVVAGRPEQVVISDTAGRFAFTARTKGRYVVRAERIGFAAGVSDTIDVAAAGDRVVTIELAPVAQRLQGVATRGTRDAGIDFMRGFERRRLRGFGSFLTRAEISARGANLLTQLLRSMMGTELMLDDQGNLIVRASRGERTFGMTGTGPCRASVYVDGIERVGEALDRMVTPPSIEGIEVYPSAATLPIEFRQGDAACGVVFIWTQSSAGTP
ncbi:MAG: TonB-dependent receptor [Gemmatimonadetes bacterium]|nr:TonB-dependent receptor [Gemmatimonadota bacterium]